MLRGEVVLYFTSQGRALPVGLDKGFVRTCVSAFWPLLAAQAAALTAVAPEEARNLALTRATEWWAAQTGARLEDLLAKLNGAAPAQRPFLRALLGFKLCATDYNLYQAVLRHEDGGLERYFVTDHLSLHTLVGREVYRFLVSKGLIDGGTPGEAVRAHGDGYVTHHQAYWNRVFRDLHTRLISKLHDKLEYLARAYDPARSASFEEFLRKIVPIECEEILKQHDERIDIPNHRMVEAYRFWRDEARATYPPSGEGSLEGRSTAAAIPPGTDFKKALAYWLIEDPTFRLGLTGVEMAALLGIKRPKPEQIEALDLELERLSACQWMIRYQIGCRTAHEETVARELKQDPTRRKRSPQAVLDRWQARFAASRQHLAAWRRLQQRPIPKNDPFRRLRRLVRRKARYFQILALHRKEVELQLPKVVGDLLGVTKAVVLKWHREVRQLIMGGG